MRSPPEDPRFTFRPLLLADLPTLHEWLCRPHVSRWWGGCPSRDEVSADYAPLTDGRYPRLHRHEAAAAHWLGTVRLESI